MATTSIGSSGVTFPDATTQASGSGVAKAWVNFNGNPVAINHSFNVSSVTRTATGNWTINYSTAMPSSNYSVQAQSQGWWTTLGSQPTTTACTVGTFQNGSFGNYDASFVTVAVFAS
jgi:hypothetical protein